MRADRRNFGLDLARAIAVSSVLLSHFLLEPANGTPVVRTALVFLGATGVELFFSLSGFLIGGLLLDLAERDLRPSKVAEFWFRRWMRTLPLYYAVLWAVGWWFSGRDPYAWLFLQNFHPGGLRLVPAAWSLVLEEYFYLFFPAAMLLAGFVLGRGTRIVAAVAIVLIVVCTAGRAGNALGVFHLGWDYVHTHPFLRMDCAAYGVLAACLYRTQRVAVTAFAMEWAGPALLAAAAAVVLWGALFVSVVLWPGAVAGFGFALWGPPWFVVQSSFLDLVFAGVVLTLFVTRPGSGRLSALAWLVRQCSLLSYSMYLVHMPVMTLIDQLLAPRPGPGKFALQLIGTVTVSVVTYFAVERPFLAVRDLVSRRRARAPTPAANPG